MPDVNKLKGRIAEALVESILWRVGFRVARVGRETHVEGLIPHGRTEFGPDFLVWKKVDSADRQLYHLLAVEVKYRADLRDYLTNRGRGFVAKAQEKWPDLYFILVTDNPDEGRSCFQVLRLAQCRPDVELATLDLEDVKELDVYAKTVHEYEGLVTQLFQFLGGQARPDG